jgi:hypothetical protein
MLELLVLLLEPVGVGADQLFGHHKAWDGLFYQLAQVQLSDQLSRVFLFFFIQLNFQVIFYRKPSL